MRRNYLRTLGGVTLIAAMGMAAGCQDAGDSGGGNAAKCGGKLAIFGAFSGGNAGVVLPSRDGATLAVETFNKANPSCTVTLVPFDTEGDPAKATPVANQVAADTSFVGVIGGAFSGESRATIPTYKAAGLALVSQSATATNLTAASSDGTFHRVVANDGVQAPAAGRYIKEVLKGAKVVVIDDGSDYGAALAKDVATVLGSAVAGTDKVQEKQTNFSATISKVKAAGADVIFYGGYTNEAAPLLKQLRGAAVTAKFVAGDGVYDAGFPTAVGNTESEGAIITCPCIPGDKAKGTFVADWKAKYNSSPGVYAAEGYDAATVFLDAFKAGKTTRADIKAYVNSYDKELATKRIKFDANGDVEKTNIVIWAYVVKDGKIVAEREAPK